VDVQISLASTIKALREQYRDMDKANFDASTARALNRTASLAKTAASKQIRTLYKVAARDLSRSLSLRKASGRSDRLEASVKAEGKPLPLRAFGARQTKAGVSFQVKNESGRKLMPGAFIITTKSGHQAVFVRATSSKAYIAGKLSGRRKRLKSSGPDLPIGEVFTVSVPKSFSNLKVIKLLQDRTRERFPDILAHELRWRSGQMG
jgi:hypothetical protein